MLTDLFETVYHLLRAEFLGTLGQALATAASWQQAEAAVFAVRAVSLSLKERALTERCAPLRVSSALVARRISARWGGVRRH